METKNIKTGEITEQELVSLFGSEAQKKSYKSNGHFIGSNKKTLLKNISKYCKIEEFVAVPLFTGFWHSKKTKQGYAACF